MPHADALVVDAAKKKGMVAVPGFSTPTEAFAMIAAGADGLKLFPAEANPPRVLRSLRAVLPAEMPVLPVGSITPETMAEYWAAGASGFGLGGALYKPGDPAQAVADRASVFMRVLGGLAARA
jgi:2-dehydro-3-deoxyphosphogalactonate aldolase